MKCAQWQLKAEFHLVYVEFFLLCKIIAPKLSLFFAIDCLSISTAQKYLPKLYYFLSFLYSLSGTYYVKMLTPYAHLCILVNIVYFMCIGQMIMSQNQLRFLIFNKSGELHVDESLVPKLPRNLSRTHHTCI